MADLRLVRQNTQVVTTDGVWAAVNGDRLGNVGVSDLGGIAMAAARSGRMYIAGDADQNDTVTGQTSFANTTPTFLLNVPSGVTAIPLFVNLAQSGSVAGDFITVSIEIDDIAAYSSGGTAETIFRNYVGSGTSPGAAVYSGATAVAGYGIMVHHSTHAEDVDPASADAGLTSHLLWVPPVPLILKGPASLKVFTYAATTAPTWLWSLGWAEVDNGYVGGCGHD